MRLNKRTVSGLAPVSNPPSGPDLATYRWNKQFTNHFLVSHLIEFMTRTNLSGFTLTTKDGCDSLKGKHLSGYKKKTMKSVADY